MTQNHSRVLPNSSRNFRGFTLTELMIGLAVMGLLTLSALPRITRIVDRAQVKSARTATFNHLSSARLAAQHGGRLVVFRTAGGRVWSEAQPRLVALFGSTRDTIGSIIDLAGEYRLTLTATFDSIVFDPRGLGTGTGMILLTRGTSRDSVVVAGLGSVIR